MKKYISTCLGIFRKMLTLVKTGLYLCFLRPKGDSEGHLYNEGLDGGGGEGGTNVSCQLKLRPFVS